VFLIVFRIYLWVSWGHCFYDRPSNYTQNTKYQILRYSPLSTLNEMMYCKERHPLLMKYFKTFARYILKLGRTLQSIFKPFIGLTRLFSTDVDSQISHKITVFNYPFSMTNEIFYSGERHPLLMKCLKSLLRYIRKIQCVTESICPPPMGLIMPFPLRSNLKLYTKYQVFLTLLVQ